MQKIYFKKLVDLNHQLKELVSISVDESINYKMESQGMRAVGSIMMNGDYKDEKGKHSFHESIDLDIMALFEKITDKRDFHVKVEDFDYVINEGNLSLVIQACVYGVLDDEDLVIETSAPRVEETNDEAVVEEIESLLREEDVVEEVPEVEIPVVEIPKEIAIPVVETAPVAAIKEETVEVKKEMPEEDDDEDIGTYYLYVVQDGDSYQSVAAHYQVDEYKLKDYNHDRPLTKGTIVIVPYYS